MKLRTVGIDLGTTHTALAWADAQSSDLVEVLALEQLVSAREVARRPLLPSFLYAPLHGEITEDPWGDSPWAIGEFARRRGQELPGRLVASYKSWLSHAGVDRNAPILPWTASSADVPRLSPVEASRRVLAHAGACFRAAFGESLADQEVVLTVPASFDQVARELTLSAAHQAGLTVRLLEEPQAALYAYLAEQGNEALRELRAAQDEPLLVLVCDVGGGTTDLTLIVVDRTAGGELDMKRVAVGRHLLLGGDNMDLTLAHFCEPRLVEPPGRLEPVEFAELVLSCRIAKERLLGDDAPAASPVRIARSGSSLVGNVLGLDLSKEDAQRIILDGFFPVVPRDAEPERSRAALVAFGLPYERDPAVTRHVAAFFRRHAPGARGPHVLLLNGGIFHSPLVTERLVDAVNDWGGPPVVALRTTEPDLSVARGAVAHGLALRGRGPQIESGAARGYYVGLERRGDRVTRAVCVVPRGAREGERHRVAPQGLALVVGQQARFDLLASDRALHAPGEVVTIDEASFEAMPPLAAAFETHARSGAPSTVPVSLEGELTPIGTLEVACVEQSESTEPPRRHRLAFDLRGEQPGGPPTARRPPVGPPAGRRPQTRPASQAPRSLRPRLEAATEALERVFGKGRTDVETREVKNMVRELERHLGERAAWTTDINRALFDVLIAETKARRRSAEHERLFWMLAGFCLRPGYGFVGDDRRVAKVIHLFNEGVLFKDETRVWQQFFIAWRRIVGGLGEGTQKAVFSALAPLLSTDPSRAKKKKGFSPLAPEEMLELASTLERLPASDRAELGRWVLERTWTRQDPRLWSALGRIGARVPTYASAHHVVAPVVVAQWLDHLLRERWEAMSSAPRAAVQMSRITGDRSRDVPDPVRAEVARRLEAVGADPQWIRAVRELVPLVDSDRAEFFGEALPIGLRLVEGEL